ncbi:MAG: right-handed parallel beta-helix repeat-containing protein, partial [Verrucomicrobiota bacterium]
MKTVRLTPTSDLARELTRYANTRVELAEGSYFLSAPLRPPTGQTLCAAPGARPVISGGARLNGWRVENGRWTLPVDFAFTQLFVNGERRPRARLPKTGFYEFESLPDGRTTEWYKGATQAVYAPGDCTRWNNLAEVRLIPLHHWYEQHLRIAAVDEASRTLTFVTRAFSSLHDESGKTARYYIENVFAALTEPGEWCLTEGKLYYLPLPGETPDNTEVIAPRLATLVRFENCRDVRLESLTFRHADWELPAENAGAVQAAFNVPGAIQLRCATDCVMQSCTVAQVAGYAVEVQPGSSGNRILDCDFHDLGAGGVKINHERPLTAVPEEDKAFAGMDIVEMGWAGEKPVEPVRAKTEVARCRIHDGGKIFHSAVGVWIGDSGFNHVHHNEIFDLYYTGISCGWSWNYAPTRTIGNVIEYNHVYNIGRKLLSDMGAIYLLGYQPGGVVRGNHIHHVSCFGYGGGGIYPDQGSSFLTIEDNIIHHTQSDALSIHYGSGMTVRNNIFALTESSLLGRGREESVLTAVVERNTFLGKSPPMLGYFWSNPQTVLLRNNRYWVAGGAAPEFAGMTFAEWQALGQDAGSVVADPGFGESLPAVVERDNDAPRAILEPRLELGAPT